MVDYDRVTKIMPCWTDWGNGVVLVSQKEWQASEARISSILRQLSRSKKQILELRRTKNKA